MKNQAFVTYNVLITEIQTLWQLAKVIKIYIYYYEKCTKIPFSIFRNHIIILKFFKIMLGDRNVSLIKESALNKSQPW